MIALSPKANLAYEKLVSSGLSDWVGGGDPIAIGIDCFEAIAAVMDLQPSMRVLDFGCGIGRMSIPMADFLVNGELIGIDIVPRMVEFCREKITPIFRNSSFVLSNNTNPLYETLASPSSYAASDIERWADKNEQSFDLIYAFSVFTHFDPAMAQSTFDLFARLLKPRGLVFATAFWDCEENPPDRKLRPGEQFRDCRPEPMSWVVHAPNAMLAMAHKAGFSPRKVLYGNWRGGTPKVMKGEHFQDALLLSRLVRIPADFDPELYVSLHPDLIAARVDGTQHYLAHGYFEGRSYR